MSSRARFRLSGGVGGELAEDRVGEPSVQASQGFHRGLSAGGYRTAASLWRSLAALVCALAVLVYVAALMTAVAVRGFLSLYRTLILGRPKEVTESGIGQVLASHWSMPLCQLPLRDPDLGTDAVAGAVLDAVQRRVAERVADAADGPRGVVDVLSPERAVTSLPGRAALRRDRRVGVFTQDPPVLVIRVDPSVPLLLAPSPPKVAGRLLLGIPWLVGGMAVVIAVLARFVADWEREDCARTPPARQVTECADRPRTYGDALYWLLNRLSGGDPEGLGAHTAYARSLGLLVTLMSLIVVGWVISSLLQQAATRTRRFGQDVTDAYNLTLAPTGPPGSGAASTANPAVEVLPVTPDAPLVPVPPNASVPPAPPPAHDGRDTTLLAGFAAGMALGVVLARRRR